MNIGGAGPHLILLQQVSQLLSDNAGRSDEAALSDLDDLLNRRLGAARDGDGSPANDIVLSLISSRVDQWLAHRKATRLTAEEKTVFASLLEIHRQLASAPDDELFATISQALERLALFANADLASLVRVSGDDLTAVPVAYWSADGVAPVSTKIHRSLHDRLLSMDDVVEISGPGLDTGIRHGLPPGIGALLTSPVRTTRGLAEHQLTLTRSEASEWTGPQRLFLKALSGHLGQALSRISSEQLFRLAFDSAPTGLTIRNHRFELVACNRAYEEFVQTPEAELIGTTPDSLVHEDDMPNDRIAAPQAGSSMEHEMRYSFPEGHDAWVRVRHSIVNTADGATLHLSHVEDITESRRIAAELQYQANHDVLTGLGNRRFLSAHLDDLFVSGTPCSILLLDLDGFKVVNDSLGHEVGDELLVTIADRIRTAVRPSDLVARLGGDEFAVLMRGDIRELEARALGERLLVAIGRPVKLSGHRIFPRASLGAAISAGHDHGAESLIRQADTAMYEAKDAGRNRMAIFTSDMDERVQQRLRIDNELQTAVENDEFVLHFQPEVDLLSGATIGAEALIRWHHPSGLRMPDEFINRAEESGQIVDVGAWVLRSACHQMRQWRDIAGAPGQVRVNLSAIQLMLPSIVHDVTTAMDDAGISPEHLCLELTESVLMDDVELSLERLTSLKRLGVTLAIDDFGTGFSSLAYLQRFPVDILKIDRSFVSRLSYEEPSSIALVESIISMAHAFDLGVVAEGIETESQAATLRDLGCVRGQGFLYSKAVPADQVPMASFTPPAEQAASSNRSRLTPGR